MLDNSRKGSRTDLVESELRTRESMYRDAVADQRRSEARIDALHREIEALRQGVRIPAEQAAQTFGLRRVTLGRSTGGVDHDNQPGDELFWGMRFRHLAAMKRGAWKVNVPHRQRNGSAGALQIGGSADSRWSRADSYSPAYHS